MSKTLISILAIVTSAIPTQVSAGVCKTAAKYVAIGGGAVASASSAASAAGYAALLHSSGGAILSSVSAGGTGYIGMGATATALGFVSSPIVIGVAAIGGVGAATIWGYCYAKDQSYLK